MLNIQNQILSLKSLHLRILDLPQKEIFTSGIGVRKSRKALIVEWEDQDRLIGFGECSCRPDPYYSDEFMDGAMLLVEQFIVPFLKKEQTFTELNKVLKKIRGWNFTKAAIELAALRVVEQKTNLSSFNAFQHTPLSAVPVGISLGIYEDFEAMKTAVEKALSIAYKRLKFKISPFVQTDFFEQLVPMFRKHNTYVSFDANGSFESADSAVLAYFITTFDTVIEQPFGTDRYDLVLKAKEKFPQLKICFDEEIKSIGDLIKLEQLGILDEVNLKLGRVGGLFNSIEIVNYCKKKNIPCWIGGMFETGIGRIQNLKLAAFLPDAKAHDLSPSDRYFLEDVVHPNIKMTSGMVDIKSLKDCKIDTNKLDKYTINRKSFRF